MDRVLVTAIIENVYDLFEAKRGMRAANKVRCVEVTDALVDMDVSALLLPKRLTMQLGLRSFLTYTASFSRSDAMFGPVRLTIQGRDCHLDVGETDDDRPVFVGRIPLQLLDWVVDTKHHRLIGNPDHGGEWGMDVF